MNKPKRGFVVPEGMAELVKGAKVEAKGEGETPPSTPPADKAPEAEKPLEEGKPPEEVKPPVEPEKAPPAPAPQAEHVHRRASDPAPEAKKPWEVASGDPTAVNFRPELSLHAKMEWVCNNVPRMSRLRILREGAEMLCDHLIEKYGKEKA